MVISEVTDNDLKDIHELQSEWIDEGITHGYMSDKEEYLKKRIGKYFYIARQDGNACGFICCEIKKGEKTAINKSSGDYLEINDLFIKKEYRGRGIGRELYDKIEEIAKNEGINQIQLYSATKDIKRVMKFYEACGFRSWYITMFKNL